MEFHLEFPETPQGSVAANVAFERAVADYQKIGYEGSAGFNQAIREAEAIIPGHGRITFFWAGLRRDAPSMVWIARVGYGIHVHLI